MTTMLTYAPNTPLVNDPVFIKAWEKYQWFLAERGMKTVTERLLADSDAGEINRVALLKEWFHPNLTLEQFCGEEPKVWGNPAEEELSHFKPTNLSQVADVTPFLTLGHQADIYNAWFYTYQEWCP